MPRPFKLSESDRSAIRQALVENSRTVRDLATQYAVSEVTIRTLLPASRRRGPRPVAQDLTGRTFGHWRVLYRTDQRPRDTHVYYVCECSCGEQAHVRGANLTGGHTSRCVRCRNRLNRNIRKE